MIRDTFFSMHRFVDVCRKEVVENWRTYILRSVMVYGMMAIVFIWDGYFDYQRLDILSQGVDPLWAFEARLFLFGFVIWGCISASFAMERMKTKTSRTVVLMTPATVFEKFFSRWLIATCGFVVVFLIAFKMADWTRVIVYMLKYPDSDIISSFPLWQFWTNSGAFYEAANSGGPRMIVFISGCLFIQSFFMLGSTIWPKNALIKTFSAGIGIVVAYTLFAVMMGKMILPDNFFMAKTDISDEMVLDVMVVIGLIFTLFNWTIAYFRFKESEIINRW